MNYQSYLQSKQWKQKAQAAKKRAGFRCQVCNRSQDEVILNAHHRTYENLGNELLEDLTVLCEGCHNLFERNKRGENPLAKALRELRELATGKL